MTDKKDIERVMKWVGSGDLVPLITMIDFEKIADGVHKLHDGKGTGWLVAHVAD